jgi:hypothetical protein
MRESKRTVEFLKQEQEKEILSPTRLKETKTDAHGRYV